MVPNLDNNYTIICSTLLWLEMNHKLGSTRSFCFFHGMYVNEIINHRRQLHLIWIIKLHQYHFSLWIHNQRHEKSL